MPTRTKARDQLDMKLHNRAMVWELIFNSRPVSRAQLAKMTDMSPTSIARIVSELSAFGLLVEMPATHVAVGRKATMLEVDREAFFCAGVDIDVDSIQTCLLDLDNQPRSFLERKLKGRPQPPEGMADTAREMYGEMLTTTGVAAGRVKAVGVSIGGMVDQAAGRVVVSPQLHWRNVEIGRMFEERFRAPAMLENDVKAAVYEEYIRHRDYRAESVAYLTIGSGIGSALMYQGRILRGGNNAAGEIGHIIVRPGGEMCDCGRRGCLYTCLSEKSILKRMRRLGKSPVGIERWIRARREGEGWAVELAEEISGYVAMAINHILCGYDPEIVLVGGRLMHSMPELLELALARKGVIYDALRSGARILHSRSNNQDSVIGAAIMAKAQYLERLLHQKE